MGHLKEPHREVIEAIYQIVGDKPFTSSQVRGAIPSKNPGNYLSMLEYRGVMEQIRRPYGKYPGLWQIPRLTLAKITGAAA